MLSSSSAGPYKPDMPMQPRPSADTFGPVRPSCRVSMRSTSPGGAPRYQDRPIGGSTIPGCGADDSAEWGLDRTGLADLLRSRRLRLVPADVGLPPGVRRRTPGLRRDEVAALASISTDYYTRLEQERGPNPSVAVLSALARALRMTDDERDHLYLLAGQVQVIP